MIIKISVRLLKKFLLKHPKEELGRIGQWRDDDHLQELEVNSLSDWEMESIQEIAEENPTDKSSAAILKKIAAYENIKKDPGGRKVGRLEDLEQALRMHIDKAEHHWLFSDSEGFYLPVLVAKINYCPYDDRSQTAAHVTLKTKHMKRGHKQEEHYHWGKEDLKGGRTTAELLQAEKLYMPTPEQIAAYSATMEQYARFSMQTGHQFIGDGEGSVIQGRWHSGKTSLVREGVAAKLVMDDRHEEGEERGKDAPLDTDSFWKQSVDKEEGAGHVAIPLHPYVKMFDLENHQFLEVNTDLLTPYVWNPKLGEKLVMPEEHKDIISILMETAAEDMDDIISGKSGGTIVICTGDPGLGKTLTAEVTSEVVQRPLYKVQCSQLGTNEESIEKRLQEVLGRATRWKALLLIDEADVYVRERGADIQQNAIVGVFLRVLEYYRGVLFMTSNRATIIDDAIMSRATIHLKYALPDREALGNIWTILSEQFKVKLPSKSVQELCYAFPNITGRDVKSLLKLAKRYQRRKGGEINLDTFKHLAIHKDITASKSRSTDH